MYEISKKKTKNISFLQPASILLDLSLLFPLTYTHAHISSEYNTVPLSADYSLDLEIYFLSRQRDRRLLPLQIY